VLLAAKDTPEEMKLLMPFFREYFENNGIIEQR
jgi:hypothetical protein